VALARRRDDRRVRLTSGRGSERRTGAPARLLGKPEALLCGRARGYEGSSGRPSNWITANTACPFQRAETFPPRSASRSAGEPVIDRHETLRASLQAAASPEKGDFEAGFNHDPFAPLSAALLHLSSLSSDGLVRCLSCPVLVSARHVGVCAGRGGSEVLSELRRQAVGAPSAPTAAHPSPVRVGACADRRSLVSPRS
jgi:hypothetical protein